MNYSLSCRVRPLETLIVKRDVAFWQHANATDRLKSLSTSVLRPQVVAVDFRFHCFDLFVTTNLEKMEIVD